MAITQDEPAKYVPAPPAPAPPRVDSRLNRRVERWQKRQGKIARRHPPRKSRLGEAGTARGQCVEVGCIDAGWRMPPPVKLLDGTAIQYYKDGQGLTAAFEAIKKA